jgi:ankyrin repeat/BTB/POZ domain-containing protein 1
LRDDNPVDRSDGFRTLCEAARLGDIKGCQEQLTNGVNVNARDDFDYTPLILVGSHFMEDS